MKLLVAISSQRVSIGSGGSGIPGASVLNNIIRDGAFKNTCFTLDINLSTFGK